MAFVHERALLYKKGVYICRGPLDIQEGLLHRRKVLRPGLLSQRNALYMRRPLCLTRALISEHNAFYLQAGILFIQQGRSTYNWSFYTQVGFVCKGQSLYKRGRVYIKAPFICNKGSILCTSAEGHEEGRFLNNKEGSIYKRGS